MNKLDTAYLEQITETPFGILKQLREQARQLLTGLAAINPVADNQKFEEEKQNYLNLISTIEREKSLLQQAHKLYMDAHENPTASPLTDILKNVDLEQVRQKLEQLQTQYVPPGRYNWYGWQCEPYCTAYYKDWTYYNKPSICDAQWSRPDHVPLAIPMYTGLAALFLWHFTSFTVGLVAWIVVSAIIISWYNNGARASALESYIHKMADFPFQKSSDS